MRTRGHGSGGAGAAFALALALALGGCSRNDANVSGARHAWTHPGELRIAIQNSPNNLNAILASNTTENMLDRLIFSVLVTNGEHGKPVPDLAREVPTLANGGVSRDGKTITYHLRTGVTWQDGVPFTSRDVAFTFAAIMNPQNDVISRNGYDRVARVETPDAATVVFHLKGAYGPAVNTIFAESDTPYGILPAHLLAKYPNLNTVPFDSAPIGTGPFVVTQWARGDHIDLAPNPRYFLGRPKLAKICVAIVTDENTELNELRTHDIDWQFEASPQQYRDLKTLPDLRVVLQDRNEYERLQMNGSHPPLDDVRVRRAIASAIDTQRLVDTLTYGSATKADQDLPPFLWAHARNVTRYPFDPAKAKALLRAAGWTPGADGVLERGGHRLSLTIVSNSTNATRRLGIVQIQAMLRRLGIEVEPKLFLGSLLFAPLGEGGILQKGAFDLAFTGWVAGIDPDQANLFTCAAWPPHGNNEYRYCNKALDSAEADALRTSDQHARAAAYARVERILTTDEPQVVLWWPRQVQPINPDFRHFTPNPVTASWNAYQWEI